MSEPSKAAWRAYHAMSECNSNEQNALTIDRETGLPELVAALREVQRQIGFLKQYAILNRVICDALRKAGEL